MAVPDTIHAVATAEGRAGVAVIRLSGPAADAILGTLVDGALPAYRHMSLRTLRDGDGAVLDRGLVVRFPASASFTGEDVAELHLHGSPAVIRAVLGRIAVIGLSRMADPGEFTRRALYNERLDLTQVQGLGQLIDAETEAQRRLAMRIFDGELGGLVRDWRSDLLEAAAYVEATIDFADEEVPEDVSGPVMMRLERVVAGLEDQLRGVGMARDLRDGLTVAIVGAPNSGKSSLLNAIARREVAIVSEIPGTTRDVLELRMDLKGLPVTFMDTAGLRETSDPVESLGIARARSRAEAASLRVGLLDGAGATWREGMEVDLIVRTKTDLHGGWGLSAHTGEGLSDFLAMIGGSLRGRAEEASLVSTLRDEARMLEALETLREIRVGEISTGPELVASSIRAASSSLAVVIGEVGVEDVLDVVFGSFCLGK